MKIIKVGVLLLTILVSIVLTSIYIESKNVIYSVDLGKIISTQKLIAGRMASKGYEKPLWMTSIKDTSEQMKTVINRIAGNHMVIVAPAVIQGSIDITNDVLKALNLPTNLPNINISQNDLMPPLIPKTELEKAKKEESETSSQPTNLWLLP